MRGKSAKRGIMVVHYFRINLFKVTIDMKNLLFIFYAAITLPLLAYAAEAQDFTKDTTVFYKPDIKSMFNDMDLNKDGTIIITEHFFYFRKIFEIADKDSNGSISYPEYEFFMSMITAPASTKYPTRFKELAHFHFNQNDSDHDGIVTQYDEMIRTKTLFKEFDANGDNTIIFKEYETGYENIVKKTKSSGHWPLL